MVIALAGVVLAMVVLPGLTHRIERRLRPRSGAWLSTALGGGLTLLEAAFVLRAGPPALRAVGIVTGIGPASDFSNRCSAVARR